METMQCIPGSAPGSSEPVVEAPVRKPTRRLIDFRHITTSLLSEVDEVLCVAVHATAVIVGTRQGFVFELDSQGGKQARIVASPRVSVIAVSLDSDGRYCACATADCTVTVLPIGGGAHELREQHTSPVLCAAICPEYGSGVPENLMVCVGTEEGQLILHKRALLGARTLIHRGEGPVTAVRWFGKMVAWANDRGVKVFHVPSGQKVTYVPRAPGSEWQRCNLAWASDERLLIGWGSSVKVAIVLQQPSTAKGPGAFYAEVRHHFECTGSALVCGVAPISDQSVAVLVSQNIRSGRQELRLCSLTGEVFHSTEVPLERGGTPLTLHLAFASVTMPMFVVSTRDLMLVNIRDFLEQAMWLIDNGHEEEAVMLANNGGDGHMGLRHITCLKCVAPHLRSNNFEQACAAVTQFTDLEAETWQECIILFDKCNALQYLAVSVPVPPRGRCLPTNVYDEVLQRLVAYPSALVTLLRLWPPEVFSAPALKEQLRSKLPNMEALVVSELGADSRGLVEALGLLEASTGNTEVAVRHLLGLGSPDVFAVLRRDLSSSASAQRSPLLGLAQANIQRLFEIDDWEACQLLVDCRATFTAEVVVTALKDCDTRWRHEYLKLLFEKDELAGANYHMQMVRLFAEFEPKGLGAFLRKSERYQLEEALAVCQSRGLLDEEAYLLGKAGRVSEALNILLEKMGDVERAVVFASQYQDPKLWETLVSYVLEHPKLLVTLLDCLESLDTLAGVGSEDSGRPQPPPTAQPAHVLRRLPQGTPVPRVAAPVRRVFESFDLQESLYESCKKLTEYEMTSCKKAFLNSYRGGSAYKPDTWRCRVCGRSLTLPPPEDAPSDDANGSEAQNCDNGIVFQGRGALHERCFKREPRDLKKP